MKTDKKIIKQLIEEINMMSTKEIKIMEVCGTHTHAISKLGIRSLLSPNIKLISGPGCPVCVSEENYIDSAIKLLNQYHVTIATFGDMIRVTGTEGNLFEEKSKGNDVRIVYSPLDLIDLLEKNKDINIVFLGVGFETTAPIVALTIKIAAERNIKNLFFLTSLKLMPPILHYILGQIDNSIDGIICPGHVASVTGADYFKFICEKYGIPASVCGFEAEDILIGIYYLLKQITNNNNEFRNLYSSCVKAEGNTVANKLIKEVFNISDGVWRGIGTIENSSLQINEKYNKFNALHIFKLENKTSNKNISCQCRDILLGIKTPNECNLFGKLCNPCKPYGPCMVSSEGSCSIAYKYRRNING